jgi:hypothetical protein
MSSASPAANAIIVAATMLPGSPSPTSVEATKVAATTAAPPSTGTGRT